MALLPAKAKTDEQTLIAHRHFFTGHRVMRQTTDVSSIAKDMPRLFQPHDTQSQKTHGGHDTEQRRERKCPRCEYAQECTSSAYVDRVEFDGGSEQ
ncbi:hypothetical protein ALO53_200200 [Pseudomonas amygdali pv. photiniae]|uniref:Uncharacterized protein n=1 Tax=Pseudomonas amygdali pv. photiniae TaxID=251724 RepID=A0A0P9TQK8_PSEA0|nr:hypothetical protein ALO53_200200 [Pseudomonas amygdali pv. photiniae]